MTKDESKQVSEAIIDEWYRNGNLTVIYTLYFMYGEGKTKQFDTFEDFLRELLVWAKRVQTLKGKDIRAMRETLRGAAMIPIIDELVEAWRLK